MNKKPEIFKIQGNTNLNHCFDNGDEVEIIADAHGDIVLVERFKDGLRQSVCLKNLIKVYARNQETE